MTDDGILGFFPTSLRERWRAVHDEILAGPYAELQRHIDDGSFWEMKDGGLAALDALEVGACVCAGMEWGEVPAYWQLRDEVGVPGSVGNAEAYPFYPNQ
jgi:hypothetical protein